MPTLEENTAPESAPESAPPAPTWPRTVKLAFPITFAKDTITELVFRRGKVGDMNGMRLAPAPATNDLLLIASRLCGQPVAALEQLDMDDAGEVIDVALDFYRKYLGTGT